MEFVKKINSKEIAKKIANWEYQPPYDIYNMDGKKESVEEILSNDYYKYSYKDILIGYFCFGDVAKVSNNNENIYKDEDYLDIGIGLNPQFCNSGKGYNFFSKAIKVGRELYEQKKFRLTVAQFNKRAIKVYKKYGFRENNRFEKQEQDKTVEFITMTYN